jgi:hypothetical protein
MKVIAAMAALILMVTGCSKLTPENYARLKVGMPYSEVTAILGSPTSCSDIVGLKNCRWGDDKRHVTVQFAGDAILLYSAQNIQ